MWSNNEEVWEEEVEELGLAVRPSVSKQEKGWWRSVWSDNKKEVWEEEMEE